MIKTSDNKAVARQTTQSTRYTNMLSNKTTAPTHILDECRLLEKVPAVAWDEQTGKTSSATNATVRCVTAKAGGGRRRKAGRRASEEAGEARGREGAKASRQAGERTAGENRVIACRENTSHATTSNCRATKTQTQIVGIVLTVRVQKLDGPLPELQSTANEKQLDNQRGLKPTRKPRAEPAHGV